MKRGTIVLAAERGQYTRKPRPWLVVQNTEMLDNPSSVTVCAISTDQRAATFRVPVAPSAENGLDRPSTILPDKILTIRSESIVGELGEADEATMLRVDAEIRFWLDL